MERHSAVQSDSGMLIVGVHYIKLMVGCGGSDNLHETDLDVVLSGLQHGSSSLENSDLWNVGPNIKFDMWPRQMPRPNNIEIQCRGQIT